MAPDTSGDCPTIELLDPSGRIGLKSFAPWAVLADGPDLNPSWRIDAEIEQPEPGCVVARASVTNTGGSPLRLRAIRWGTDPYRVPDLALRFPSALAPRYFATENFRGDFFAVGTTEGDAFFEPLTNQRVEVGWSEDKVFPGVFIAAAEEQVGLLCAQASQDRLHAIFRFGGRKGDDQWMFEVDEVPCGQMRLQLAPGQTMQGEKLFFCIAPTNDPQQATDAYYRQLRRDGRFPRADLNPLPEQRIYCSWNYDFFADITEDDLVAQCAVLKKHFPSVKFVQLDDGYQHEHAPNQRAMIDLCYGLDEPFNREKFPSGPKGLADRIKAEGLRPAIWLGLWASLGSKMLADHPDWVLHDESGRALSFGKWYGGTGVLDPSVPEVWDYLDRMCATVFGEWGFEGLKLDFSSFAFNIKRVRYRCPGVTAAQCRHRLEAVFRKHLPADGFFGWCVVAGTGQPFLSHADYFRCALDIGHGDWPTARRIANWVANTGVLLQQRPCLPNIDSIGWSDAFDETAWRSWLNLAAVSGMAIEVSGDLRKLDQERLARLARTLELSDPRRRVRCLDLPRGRIEQPPALWLAVGEDGSALVGAFNWSDEKAAVSLTHPELAGVSGEVTDAWTGEAMSARGLPDAIALEAHASRLFAFRIH